MKTTNDSPTAYDYLLGSVLSGILSGTLADDNASITPDAEQAIAFCALRITDAVWALRQQRQGVH